MNLHEFCNDSQVLEYLHQLHEGDLNAKKFIADKMGGLSIEHFEIGKCFASQCKITLGSKEWEQVKEDIQQKLVCDKLLVCKFSFRPTKGKLQTFITTIVVRMAIDEHRSRCKAIKFPMDEAKIDEEKISFVWPLKKKPQVPPILRLKKECYREVQMQSCLRRTILKLWRPYFFEYEFEPDEMAFLQSKKLDLVKIKIQMQQLIKKELKTDHRDITISSNNIAEWLQMGSNAVDRHLTVLRQKLSWLRKENLQNALAEENF